MCDKAQEMQERRAFLRANCRAVSRSVSPSDVMEMHVRVDAAWYDDMPRCLDHMLGGVGRQRSGSGDRGDRLAGDRDITAHDPLGCDHVATANNEIEHVRPRRADKAEILG